MDAPDRHQVVVGVDGSPAARNALRWAGRLARLLDDGVTAVHGAGLLEHVGKDLVLTHPQLDSLREVVDREWCGPLTSAGLPHQVRVVERPAVDALLAAAAEGRVVAACSHGDVIPAVVATATRRGADLEGPRAIGKAGRYVCTVEDGQIRHIQAFPPPDGEG